MEALTTKIGPLPAWQWAAGIGAALAVVVLIRRRSTSSAAPAATSSAPSSVATQIQPVLISQAPSPVSAPLPGHAKKPKREHHGGV